MSDSRRDFLRFAAAGAGSLAAIGLGTDPAQACCWWSSSPRSRSRDQFRDRSRLVPDIDFETPTNDSEIARSFTIYGTYVFEGTPDIECKLWKSGMTDIFGAITHQATNESMGTWMADFTVLDPPAGGTTGLTLTAKLIGPNEVDEALNLRLFSDMAVPGPPITIGNPGSRIAKPPIKKKAKPHGMVHDSRISAVWVTYIHEGLAISAPHKAELIPAQGQLRKWRVKDDGEIVFDKKHYGKTKVACVVEAHIVPDFGPIKRFLVSDHTNTIES